MGIKASHLRTYIIRPTLQEIGLWSQVAENLLLGTAAQESGLGSYLHQEGGPALGIYQIEPNTHDDVWKNFLNAHMTLDVKVSSLKPMRSNYRDDCNDLIWNLKYATAIARVIYYRVPEDLPQETDVNGLAAYWKTHYNTSGGDGKISEFIQNYKIFVDDI